ncbi:MAG TPA: lysylphosphatidylglycerol synthase domain-containing protein [Thermoanaerobaculia bacterium]|nr:lysylphosphatidylglycerol synthase domain-containing protein [Thermoanaerobaculia bacterium]
MSGSSTVLTPDPRSSRLAARESVVARGGVLRGPVGAVIRGLGLLVAVACLVWVALPLRGRLGEIGELVDLAGLWQWLALAALAHAVLNTLVSAGWWWLAGIYGQRPSFATGYTVYALSRLMKYLPGNFLHYFGRQVFGVRAGLSHEALVASAVIEMSALIAAAAGATLLALGLRGGDLVAGGVVAFAGAVLVLLGWPAFDRVARRAPVLARRMAGHPPVAVADLPRLYLPALGFYLAFFLGAGAVLLGLAHAVARQPITDGWSIVGLYPAAWIAGTVALGAPAGLGVREAILGLGLAPQVGPVTASVLALSLRVVTLLADLLTAGVGLWIRSRQASPAAGVAESGAAEPVTERGAP